jgi:glycosyltransferase involved in cell wall biosynthesis
MTDLTGRRLIHVTTADISLALLLGPQLRAFAEAGMDVIGASAPGPFVDELTSWGIRHVPLRHATRSVSPADDIAAFPELLGVFRRLRPDIVHTHNPKPGLYGRIAARLAGVPGIVNTVHGLYAAPEDPWPRRTVVYALERAASTCSSIELFQNPEDLEVMRRLRVPTAKLELLGNGVDLTRFQSDRSADRVARARKDLGVEKAPVVIGTVGRLVWGKGFRELFAAAARMRTTHPEVVFVIVGPEDTDKTDGLQPADLAAARALGNVVLAGHRDDVEDLYAGFDVYVLPSYREGFPRSAMEAAACGVPVIATDIRGCRQAVDDGVTGLLVPLHDVDALARAIGTLADDAPRRSMMGENARRKAEEEFDDRRIIEHTLSAYERLPVGSASWTAGRTDPSPGSTG